MSCIFDFHGDCVHFAVHVVSNDYCRGKSISVLIKELLQAELHVTMNDVSDSCISNIKKRLTRHWYRGMISDVVKKKSRVIHSHLGTTERDPGHNITLIDLLCLF